MRTITYNAYTFDELSDEAKAKAIIAAREKERYWDMEHNVSEAMATIKKAADSFGFALLNWSIGPDAPTSYVTLTDSHLQENEDIKGLRLRTWLINNTYGIFYESKPQGEYRKRDNGAWKYDRRSKVQVTETCCPFTGVTYDESLMDVFRAFLKKPTDHTLEELFKSAVDKVCKDLQSEEEYQQSDEGITEFLLCNDVEFTEDGELL